MTGTSDDEEYNILLKLVDRKVQDILPFSWPQREVKCHIPFVHVFAHSASTVTVWKEWTTV
jgi:hypothetical protein